MRAREVCVGDRFGKLVVIGNADDRVTKSGYVHKCFLCQCDCGKTKIVTKRSLTLDNRRSCGCLVGVGNFKDITGQRFGRLIAISPIKTEQGYSWKCQCDCGNETIVRVSSLMYGDIKSCGCYIREITAKRNKTHGMTGTRLYQTYRGMVDRCENQKSQNWRNYGGRGIRICEEWRGDDGFVRFKQWAETNGYTDALTIDRIDVNGNYEPDNCRWSDAMAQANNRRHNVVITHNGETMTVAQWARKTGVSEETIRSRLAEGME